MILACTRNTTLFANLQTHYSNKLANYGVMDVISLTWDDKRNMSFER